MAIALIQRPFFQYYKISTYLNKERRMSQELDRIILTTDLPEYGLEQGDIGTVVLVHQSGAGYEAEFVTLNRDTVAVVSLYN